MAEPLPSGASPLPHKKLHRSGEILLLFAASTLRNAFLLCVLGRPVPGGATPAIAGVAGAIEGGRGGTRSELIHLGPSVGGGLLPMAVCQSTSVWLNHCYREQAPLPHKTALQWRNLTALCCNHAA